MMLTDLDTQWMQQALNLAKKAAEAGEVPVGAVITSAHPQSKRPVLIAEGYNQPIKQQDPSAHAEIIAIRQAAKIQKNYRLTDATLYVTLEPCAMCVGAIIQARIKRVVFAASDPKAGCVDSVFPIIKQRCLNHHVDYDSGLLADESVTLLQDFFRARR